MSILDDILPGGFEYGKIFLVEFDPSSLWFETTIMLTARAAIAGTKCEYHALQHSPADITLALGKQGLRTGPLIQNRLFRIIDYFTPLARLGRGDEVPDSDLWKSRDSFNLTKWGEETRHEILRGFAQKDKRWVHVDDNMSVLLQLFEEDDLADFYRTTMVPWTRARELVLLSSVVTGVASEGFYRKFEASADGVIDFASREEDGEIKQWVRLRSIKGGSPDTRWRQLKPSTDGTVSIVDGKKWTEVAFHARSARAVFNYLLDEFIGDFMGKNLNPDAAGWRTLAQISSGTRLSESSLYTQYTTSGPIFAELKSRGFIEAKLFLGQRGRGGKTTRIRVAYGKEPVKLIVNQRVREEW